MPFIPKAPASCDHLDLALVERTLTKHFGCIPTAARELGVSGPDLRRLTWANSNCSRRRYSSVRCLPTAPLA
jgi:hypothetical protein